MRYLPQDDRDRYPWDSYWGGIITDIRARLQRTPVLRPANPVQPLRLLSASRRLLPTMVDGNDEPLFPDIAPECYLSQQYQARDLLILAKYGLKAMRFAEWHQRVRHDLAAPNSIMKSTGNQDWHSRVASCLNRPFEISDEAWQSWRARVRELDLVPLSDGRWVSIDSGPVYYPQTSIASLDIPLQLGLDVVEGQAAANATRKRLFDSVGVQAASVHFVRGTIFAKSYHEPTLHTNIRTHLHFLYLSHHLVQSPYHYGGYILAPESGTLLKCSSFDFYIRNDDPYGAGKLLGLTPAGPEPGDGAPGFEPVYILLSMYFENQPDPPTRDSRSWKDWLHEFLGVRRHLRLLDADGTKLSAICDYVVKHRPDKFVGFLQTTWELDGPTPANEKAVIDKLLQVEVLCRGGSMRPLRSTYLPIRRLTQLSSRFLDDDEFFPWLQLDTEADVGREAEDTFPPKWVALGEAFGLGFGRSQIAFLLDVVQCLVDANPSPEDLARPQRVYELYINLQAEVRKSSSPDEQEALLRYVP